MENFGGGDVPWRSHDDTLKTAEAAVADGVVDARSTGCAGYAGSLGAMTSPLFWIRSSRHVTPDYR